MHGYGLARGAVCRRTVHLAFTSVSLAFPDAGVRSPFVFHVILEGEH